MCIFKIKLLCLLFWHQQDFFYLLYSSLSIGEGDFSSIYCLCFCEELWNPVFLWASSRLVPRFLEPLRRNLPLISLHSSSLARQKRVGVVGCTSSPCRTALAAVVRFSLQILASSTIVIAQGSVLDHKLKQRVELEIQIARFRKGRGRLESGAVVHHGDAKTDPGIDFAWIGSGTVLTKLNGGLSLGDEILQIDLVVPAIGIHHFGQLFQGSTGSQGLVASLVGGVSSLLHGLAIGLKEPIAFGTSCSSRRWNQSINHVLVLDDILTDLINVL